MKLNTLTNKQLEQVHLAVLHREGHLMSLISKYGTDNPSFAKQMEEDLAETRSVLHSIYDARDSLSLVA